MYQSRSRKFVKTGLLAIATLAACQLSSAATQTAVFSYPNGFANASASFATVHSASFSGNVMLLTNGLVGEHEAGAVWLKSAQNVTSFTTNFTFKVGTTGSTPIINGITFCIQNSNTTTNPNDQYGPHSGLNAGTDANVSGYGAYAGQYPIGRSVAIKFDVGSNSNWESVYPAGGSPSATGLFINGGPYVGLFPEIDLNPAKINLNSGHVMAATVVYDGTLLTMTLRDTVTNAQFRTSWRLDIPAIVGGNTAYVGFTAGEIPPTLNEVLSWNFSTGYSQRVATPTFSVPAGTHSTAQTVAIDAPAGATVYFTTDGSQPTTSSPPYSGPISVAESEVVQAVAVKPGYTDSLVAAANYQIAPTGTPLINFPNGFGASTGAQNLITSVGASQINGASIQLTNSSLYGNNGASLQVGAAWYVVPVNVTSFTTNFSLQFTHGSSMGMTFCIQNQNPASTDASSQFVSGGPYAVGNQTGFGYSGTTGSFGQISGFNTSVAVVFDVNSGSGDLAGLYKNGANPFGSSIDMSSSGVVLRSGHPINVKLVYNGTTLAMTATDSVTHASFSHSWTIDIPTTVAGKTAYVGFTGSTYWSGMNQDILSWTYATEGQSTTSPPVPAAPTNLQVH